MPSFFCRAEKSDGGAAFFATFFMPAEKAGDQNILNAGRKSQLFFPFPSQLVVSGYRVFSNNNLYLRIFELQRP